MSWGGGLQGWVFVRQAALPPAERHSGVACLSGEAGEGLVCAMHECLARQQGRSAVSQVQASQLTNIWALKNGRKSNISRIDQA